MIGNLVSKALTATSFLLTPSSTYPKGGTRELLNAYQTSPFFRAVVHKIAMHCAKTPWVLYRSKGERGRSLRGMGRKARMAHKSTLIDEQVIEPITDHPLLELINNPNPMLTGLQTRKLIFAYYDVKGESFLLLERDNAGIPSEAWPIPPHWVKEFPSQSKPYWSVQLPRGSALKVAVEDLVPFIDPSLDNPYGRGVGFGESLGDEIETDEYLALMVKNRFLNQGTPDLIVGVEGAKKENVERAEEVFNTRHRGILNSGKAFFHGGKIAIQKIQQTFVEMQLHENRKWIRDTVLNVYGLPPEILGVLENSNRATIDAAQDILIEEVVEPRLETMKEEWQQKIVDPIDSSLVLDYVLRTRGDEELQLKASQANPHTLTDNEWRAKQGLEPTENHKGVYHIKDGHSPRVVDANQQLAEKETADALSDEGDGGSESKGKKSKGRVTKILDPDSLLAFFDDATLTDELRRSITRAYDLVASWEFNNLGAPGPFDNNALSVGEHLAELPNRSRLMNETTKGRIRAEIVKMVEEGAGPRAIARKLKDTIDNPERAMTIARTEVNRTANHAIWQAQVQSGIVQERKWLSTRDGNVRDWHADLDGVKRAIGEPFTSPKTGAEGMHPGAFGTGEDDINCRCTTVAVMPEFRAGSAPVTKGQLEEFERFTDDIISGVAKSVQRALRLQLNPILERIE